MAQQAAGEIHSDIERGFIRAEVVGFTNLITHGSLRACRDHGEVRLEGKEYTIQDGDVINFSLRDLTQTSRTRALAYTQTVSISFRAWALIVTLMTLGSVRPR